jgi:hypothetical protein
VGEERLPGNGQGQPTVALPALDEPRVERSFELRDLLADGALHISELRGRTAE